ncbi:hypothetical protein BVRB_4g080260 [Beta vulgaris subsp. vulgaris]|nr:hypothetical protein BVRB_4g080260 [Beta vulgaris subsp. vulgaris]
MLIPTPSLSSKLLELHRRLNIKCHHCCDTVLQRQSK